MARAVSSRRVSWWMLLRSFSAAALGQKGQGEGGRGAWAVNDGDGGGDGWGGQVARTWPLVRGHQEQAWGNGTKFDM